LFKEGRPKEALDAYRQALALDPELFEALYNLGRLHQGEGRLDEAIAAYRQALAVNPDLPEAHCNLGLALLERGRFREGLAFLERGHALAPPSPRWRYPSAEWVKSAKRLNDLDARLTAVLTGQVQPRAGVEWLELAEFSARFKRQPATATRFYTAAFEADPRLARDWQA